MFTQYYEMGGGGRWKNINGLMLFVITQILKLSIIRSYFPPYRGAKARVQI